MNKLREIRLSRKLTQQEIAKALNVKVATVSRWENGKFYPKVDKLIKLARFLDCKLEDLVIYK